MYQIGEFVVYGNNGVCRVEKIGPIAMAGVDKERQYYTLSPVYTNGSTVFTPVDGKKTKLRPLITKSQIDELLNEVENLPTLQVADEKKREEVYRTAYKTYDCSEWIKLIKTSYLRKQERVQAGRHATANDEKYLHLAEESLYGELAISLHMSKEDVAEYIKKQIEQRV